MLKYNELKKKYDVLIRQTLEQNKRILIESFVEYYGEEFRYKIEKRYNEITFVYFIDWDIVDLVVKEFIPKVDNPDRYIDFINFSNSNIKSPLSKIFKKQKQQSNLPDNLIGMTNTSILNKDTIVRWLFEKLNEGIIASWNYGSVNHMDRLITFPILYLNECAIIHEINHVITRDNLAIIVEDDFPIGVISKTGLSIDVAKQNSGERNIEELLNEKASRDIERIFKAKGGDLSSFCLDIPLVYIYEHNLYLIDDFYTRFKQYIKISRISDNKNELISRIGRSEYEEFVKLVNMYYTEDTVQAEFYKDNALSLIRKIVDQMSKNLDNSSSSLSIDEMNAYLEQLKKSGYDLKMIDSMRNQSEDFKRK